MLLLIVFALVFAFVIAGQAKPSKPSKDRPAPSAKPKAKAIPDSPERDFSRNAMDNAAIRISASIQRGDLEIPQRYIRAFELHRAVLEAMGETELPFLDPITMQPTKVPVSL